MCRRRNPRRCRSLQPSRRSCGRCSCSARRGTDGSQSPRRARAMRAPSRPTATRRDRRRTPVRRGRRSPSSSAMRASKARMTGCRSSDMGLPPPVQLGLPASRLRRWAGLSAGLRDGWARDRPRVEHRPLTGCRRTDATRREAPSGASFVLRMSGVPERTRTSDLQVRNLTLYPLSYGHPRDPHRSRRRISGGEGGIRTLGRGNPLQRFSKPPH